MLKLISNKGHSLEITEDSFAVTPEIEITEIVNHYRNDKLQLLTALSQLDSETVWAVEADDVETNTPVEKTDFSLSVVNIIPDKYLSDINTIASIYGTGEGSLSVKLVGQGGVVYWGCHSWWKQSDYSVFTDPVMRSQVVPSYLAPSLKFLYERLSFDGIAQDNWEAALTELGLTVVEE